MSEGRFYTIALLVFASLVMFVLLLFDYLQPEGMNWELVKEVLKIVGMIVPALLILMNMNAARRITDEKLDTAAGKAAVAAEKADTARETVSHLPEMVATKLREDGITSSFAPPKEDKGQTTRFKR